MHKKIFKGLFIIAFLFSTTTLANTFKVPALRGPINDYANIIDESTERSLDNVLRQVKNSTGTQIAVLTVDSLNDIPIEMASIEVTDKWKLGNKDTDKGVLFFISKNDRKLRIEVGQGLEGDLPDAYSKRIIDQAVVPFFKEGRFSDGISNGVVAILKRTNPELKSLPTHQTSRSARGKKKKSSFSTLFEIFIFILIIFFTRSRRGFFLGGGSYRGGGGFGGGGFGGGGGGFSGGGASGSW